MADKQPIRASQIAGLLKSQAYKCALTGRDLTPETASLDHINPVARGGEHVIENLWIVHHQVNTAKGTMSVDDFIQMCREVADLSRQSDCCANVGPSQPL